MKVSVSESPIAVPADANARPARPVFEKNLEALRGLAAFVVLLHHGVTPRFLDPGFALSGILSYDPPGHDSVILFFVLSGFVIGITNRGYLTWAGVGDYIKKRMLRIYPIYFVSVVFALVVATVSYAPLTIALNLLFGQIVWAPVIQENGPIWTLHYEVVFYLLFIPFSLFRLEPKRLILILTTLGILNYFVQDAFYTPLLSTYLFGFSFWLMGIVLSRQFKDKLSVVSYPLLVSQLLLFMSLNYMNPIPTLLRKATLLLFHHPLSFSTASVWYNKVNVYDFGFAPYAVLFMLVFVNASFRFRRPILLLMQLLPALNLVYIFKMRHDLAVIHPYIIPAILYVVSTLIFFAHHSLPAFSGKGVVDLLVKVGSVSYGLYIIHYPFIYIFSKTTSFSGTPLTYLVRLLAFIAVSFIAAYFLEKRFQLFVKKLVMGQKGPTVGPKATVAS